MVSVLKLSSWVQMQSLFNVETVQANLAVFSYAWGPSQLCLFCAEPGLDPDAPWTSHGLAGSKTTLGYAGSPSRLCVSLFQ